jgi:hypothetical protein
MLVPIADGIGRKLYNRKNPLFLHKHHNAAYPILSALEDSFRGTPPSKGDPGSASN